MLGFLFDWVAFTVPAGERLALLELMPGELVPLDRGWRGYTHAGLILDGKGMCGWSPDRPEMGFHVSLSSSALGVLCDMDSSFRDLRGFIGVIVQGFGGHLTRVDLAWDDREGLLDIGEVRRAARDGEYTTRWGNKESGIDGRFVQDFGPQARGSTVYFGSKVSDSQLRIYDKAAEQGVNDHWVRVELQFRGKRAKAASLDLIRADWSIREVARHFAGVLRGYLSFRVPGGDSNKSRWAVAAWWGAFLGWAERASLTVEVVTRTVDDVRQWIADQVAPSLAVVVEALGFNAAWAWLHHESVEGRSRWRARHRLMLARYSSSS